VYTLTHSVFSVVASHVHLILAGSVQVQRGDKEGQAKGGDNYSGRVQQFLV